MIDVSATHGHYWAHIQSVFNALPDELRGDIYATPTCGIPGALSLKDVGRDPDRLTLCAGHPDLIRMRHRTGIMLEHGCGQSYGADPVSARNPAHPGGDRRDKARLFLMPNEQSAARDRNRYPDARVEIIGSPRLAELQQLPTKQAVSTCPVVAILSRWPSTVSKESGSAWGHWHGAFADLAQNPDYETIGHAHPRAWEPQRKQFERMGIRPVQAIEDVIQTADVVVAENTSSMYECAALGIPVVVLDAPWFRPTANHGLRFWDCADIGPRIMLPEALPTAIESALNIRPWPGAEEILERVFPPVANPAEYAAEIIADELAKLRTPVRSAR